MGATAAVVLTWTKWQAERRTRTTAASQAATADLFDTFQQQLEDAEQRRRTDLDHFQAMVDMERTEVNRLQHLIDMKRAEVNRLQHRLTVLVLARRALVGQLLDAGMVPSPEGITDDDGS